MLDDCDPEDVLCQEFEGRLVVDNWRVVPGDVTVCPYEGLEFEVQHDSLTFPYEGYLFVLSCDDCLEDVEADPGHYFDHLIEEAGGPGPDPDPNRGGTIDDED